MARVIGWLVLGVSVIAFTPLAMYALSVAGGAGHAGPPLKLGPTNAQTCFLSGVSGDFLGNPALYAQPDIFLPASAEVFEQDGFWFLQTRAGVGTGVFADVICINVTANRVEFPWGDNISSQGVPATPNRHCFLRSVWATSGLSGQVGALQTNLTIRKIGNEFNMNGSFVNHAGGDYNFGGAIAVCVDIVPSGHWGFTFIGPTNATNSATTTVTLRNFFPNGPPVPVAGVGCFLTGIAGRWMNANPDPLGWFDGTWLTGDPKVSPNWQITVSNGRQANVTCLE